MAVFVVAGVSGGTGSVVAQSLLDHGHKVRVIVRTEDKGKLWADKGAEVAIADLKDPEALRKALNGAEAAYLLNPPSYHTKDMFADAKQVVESFRTAIQGSDLQRVVFLSSIGSELSEGTGNIKTTQILESALSDLKIPTTFLRCAWFLENWMMSVKCEAKRGEIESFLEKLDQKIPMVGAGDIGNTAAKLMTENWIGKRVIQLSGPEDYSPNDIAQACSKLLSHPVRAVAKPRSTWMGVITEQWHLPENVAQDFCEMFDGFNSGIMVWDVNSQLLRGQVTLETALSAWL